MNEAEKVLAPEDDLLDDFTYATSSSTAQEVTGNIGGDPRGYWTFVATTDAYIVFGKSDVAAADATKWPLYAKEEQSFTVTREKRWFRIIGATAAGTLHFRRG